MLIKAITLIIPVCWSSLYTIASPVPNKKDRDYDAKVLYDQRQEGEWNVRAHLDNFIIMIIPQSVTSSTSSPNLLDLLTKSFPKGSYFKRVKHIKRQKPDSDPIHEETLHFIESKTAPYHVDLSKSDTNIQPKEDVVLTSSPSITVVKPEKISHKRSARSTRHYVLTIPADEHAFRKYVEPKSAIRKHKKTIKEKTKQELKLIGAENEQCGPGMVRDSYGICKVLIF